MLHMWDDLFLYWNIYCGTFYRRSRNSGEGIEIYRLFTFYGTMSGHKSQLITDEDIDSSLN
ncbi:hypothetical protein VPAL9027_02236 [Vibrio palustris]|uniref:Uncharacterized protein n=1 Tax=Vibrio palustris TaxID=1918946 RepID=A0A1R4B5Q0_9VIBR|nr:hypothetical protein VPAL9027_02236 [Vibrio palustris]